MASWTEILIMVGTWIIGIATGVSAATGCWQFWLQKEKAASVSSLKTQVVAVAGNAATLQTNLGTLQEQVRVLRERVGVLEQQLVPAPTGGLCGGSESSTSQRGRGGSRRARGTAPSRSSARLRGG
ncbi:hypothetical protein FQN55_000345 [Onygenales sp. PD_40]|nr:hypothetical protein FQN55_000345 [Onygenales sp. PD_40]KAK2785365.1 hypothetical protein FQN53_007806 [Emmonsiellopsis sp. PD_33]KAK2794794.1 hypothetical protein FQN52_007564 [Onygenales sp. PD_12]KAK2806308.1 hypothetical protein FQN51_007349 [Onygenales sp. PD_10]